MSEGQGSLKALGSRSSVMHAAFVNARGVLRVHAVADGVHLACGVDVDVDVDVDVVGDVAVGRAVDVLWMCCGTRTSLTLARALGWV